MKKLAVGVATLLAIGLSAAPASAHQNAISGVVRCDVETGQQVVIWSNTGDPNHGTSTITASNRAAVVTGQDIPAGQTVVVGSETFPNDATGTVTLTETWEWGSDDFHNTNSASVELGILCSSPTPPPTTPPPTTPPPTTPPPTSSTPPPPTTSTVPPPPDPTCIPRPTGDHVSPNPDYCTADTGADLGNLPWIMGGFTALGIVGLMLTRKRTLG